MALRSKLFRGDQLLEAAANLDAAHITRGAKGAHVGKIQQALTQLDGADIAADEAYGPATAAAVLNYKTKRKIINFSYQTTPDDIVGKMTIAALDAEMVLLEGGDDDGPLVIKAIKPPFRGQATAQQLASFNSTAASRSGVRGRAVRLNAVRGAPPATSAVTAPTPSVPSNPIEVMRLQPRTTGVLEIANGIDAFARCDNASSRGDFHERTCTIYDQDDPSDPNWKNRLIPEPKNPDPDPTFGGRLTLKRNPQKFSIDALKPGNAFISVDKGVNLRMVVVQVRAIKKGIVTGSPAPTIAHPDSAGFISGRGEEGGVPGGMSAGRPMKPKIGSGRNINIGGEHETPGFEDYTADLDWSACPDFPDRKQRTFRPWTADDDSTVRVNDGEAINICMRATPATDINIAEVRRIAAAGCRFTYWNVEAETKKILNAFAGRKIIDQISGNDFAVVFEL
jgi:hypothetical protein